MMTSEKSLRGVTQAAVGCLFLYFDFSINQWNLLPQFVAYGLFLAAIENLREENRDFSLLTPLGVLMTGWHLADWLLTILGSSLEGKIPVAHTLAAIVNLYFCFQLYTDFAALAARFQQEGSRIDRQILHCRTVLTISYTVLSLPLPWDGQSGWQKAGMVLALAVMLGAALWLTVQLFRLRGQMKNRQEKETGI